MVIKESPIYLLILALLLQLGCSSITQIQLPIQAEQNESEIKSLNDFGENFS